MQAEVDAKDPSTDTMRRVLEPQTPDFLHASQVANFQIQFQFFLIVAAPAGINMGAPSDIGITQSKGKRGQKVY
jgi:hypothetical protein